MSTTQKTRRYWPVPPMKKTIYEYDSVNNDKNYQIEITDFFYNDFISLLNYDDKFKKFKKLKLDNKKLFIYKILAKIVRNTNLNWYDLRSNYIFIKNYIYKKLSTY
jgi:hypothetical protein